MKHILPILALTTLAAAASAQTAAPAVAGLSYNRVTVSRQGQNNSLSASAFLGSSNVLATIGSSTQTVITPTFFDPIVETRNVTTFSLGYVFKNVAFGTDATVGITSGNNSVNTAVSVNLRRALNEVVHGLEIAVGASFSENADFSGEPANKGSSTVVTAELAYNINKSFQVAYGISNANPTADIAHVVSVRYNF
jgi:hypothetical protein